MKTYNPNTPSAIKYAVNLRAINQESYLIKGSLYSMRETIQSLCSDATAGTQSETDLDKVLALYHEASAKVDELNKLVGVIKAKGEYNCTEYFAK